MYRCCGSEYCDGISVSDLEASIKMQPSGETAVTFSNEIAEFTLVGISTNLYREMEKACRGKYEFKYGNKIVIDKTSVVIAFESTGECVKTKIPTDRCILAFKTAQTLIREIRSDASIKTEN